MKLKFGLILTLSILLFACKKDGIPNLTLPAITETGQNTLGFLIDNKVWTNYGKRCAWTGSCRDNKVEAYLYHQANTYFDFGLSAAYTITSEAIDQSFLIKAKNVTTIGTFYFDSILDREISFVANSYSPTFRIYINKSNSAVMRITKFDTTNKIVSGNFEGTLFNPRNLSDSIKIEQGRFDAILD